MQTQIASAMPDGAAAVIDANPTERGRDLGRRAGDLVFLGTHTPHRADGKLVQSCRDLVGHAAMQAAAIPRSVFVDICTDRIVAQTLQVMANIEDTLHECGGALRQLVHLRIFLADLIDETFAIRALKEALPGGFPSAELIAAINSGSDPDIVIHADAVALALDSAWSLEHIYVPRYSELSAPFPSYTRAGPFVVTSALSPVECDPEVSAEVTKMVGAFGRLDDRAAHFVSQQAKIWASAIRILENAGLRAPDVVHHLAWSQVPMRALANGSITRQVREVSPEYALTCFPVSGLRRQGAMLEGRFIAIDPKFGATKRPDREWHGLSDSYMAAIAAAGYLFTAGEVPIDLANRLCVTNSVQDPSRRTSESGIVYADRTAGVQASYIYGLLRRTLDGHGVSQSAIVHQTLYLVNVADQPAVDLAWWTEFGFRPPPTTVVPIVGASPSPQTRLEIELTAYMGGKQ